MTLSLDHMQVGKAATSYTKVLQETVVAKAPLLADFNKEQEEFIKSKVGSVLLVVI